MYYPILNREIVRYCAANHMTHRQFADSVGIGDVALREKRTGRRSFTLTEAMAVATKVRKPLEYLCSVKRDRPGSVRDFEIQRYATRTTMRGHGRDGME